MNPRCLLSILPVCFWSLSLGASDLAVEEVTFRDYPHTIQFDGVLEAINQATISAQTTGRVLEVNFDVDDYVPEGSVVIRLRDEEQRSNLDAASAALSESNAYLDRAQAEHKRVADLYDKKLIAKSALDRAVADLKAAQQRRNAALAKQQQAREQLDYTVIKAPYAGIVVERLIEPGEMATPGRQLMTGIAVDDMRVTASVPQRFIERVRQNSRARIIVDEPDKQVLVSEKITFYPYADPATHTFTVRVELPKSGRNLYPGMMASVAFDIGTERLLTVAKDSVAQRSVQVGALFLIP